MSSEANKALIERGLEEVMNRGNMGFLHELVAPTFVNHDMPAPEPGPEGFGQVLNMFRTGFPDMHVSIEATIAEGDLVSTRGFFTGTHRGEFMGIPATGKQIRVKYMDAWRIENGKAVENWVQMDTMSLMQQLGVIPAPAPAPG